MPTPPAHRPVAKDANPYDALEFELTDIEAARAAHDEIPPGVGVLPPAAVDWEEVRRRPVPTDRALLGTTIDWMLSLPQAVRPYALCDRYPRVANALAAVWHLPQQRAALLEELVFDRRGNRTGFPGDVRGELEALWRG
jgi:hypothetical protein